MQLAIAQDSHAHMHIHTHTHAHTLSQPLYLSLQMIDRAPYGKDDPAVDDSKPLLGETHEEGGEGEGSCLQLNRIRLKLQLFNKDELGRYVLLNTFGDN